MTAQSKSAIFEETTAFNVIKGNNNQINNTAVVDEETCVVDEEMHAVKDVEEMQAVKDDKNMLT